VLPLDQMCAASRWEWVVYVCLLPWSIERPRLHAKVDSWLGRAGGLPGATMPGLCLALV
jgi:hypothetical protein